jgi:hypothetical protein
LKQLVAIQPDPWVGLLTGRELGPYRLERRIGGGNFSHVFESVHRPTDGRFAVKVLKPGADSA